MYIIFFKPLLDYFIAIILFPLLLVVFAIISCAIYIDDGGPIFYSADRLGKNTKKFRMYKFRTMKVNSEDIRNPDGSTFNSENDPRVTRIGRFLRKSSLDELPQIINVVLGEMSLVGPRPDLASQIKYYDMNAETKFQVKPGITGYAQVNGRNELSWEDKLKLDREYIKSVSLLLDIKIILLTIVKVLKREGVNKHA